MVTSTHQVLTKTVPFEEVVQGGRMQTGSEQKLSPEAESIWGYLGRDVENRFLTGRVSAKRPVRGKR